MTKKIDKNIYLKSIIKRVVDIESNAIENFKEKYLSYFIEPLNYLKNVKGKIIISGMGKSGLIAQKIVSTLNSFGILSLYIHPSDGLHGDLGIITKNDVIIILSKSGESPEIRAFTEQILVKKNTCIAIVGNNNSFLAKNSKYVIPCHVPEEACIYNLAPTSSTTIQLLIGDVLAVCLMELKKVPLSQFKNNHPGGNIGKNKLIEIGEFVSKSPPFVSETTPIKSVILNISKNRMGATVVINKNHQPVGIVTDGDLRRLLEADINLKQLVASDICTKSFKSVQANYLAKQALNFMNDNNINQIIVLKNKNYFGLVHLLDLINYGLLN